MANENFTTYTEVDPNSRITKTSTKVTWAALDRNETAYVYKDKGVDFFDGDFTHLLTVYMTTLVNGSYVYAWALTNDLNSIRVIDNANGDALGVWLGGLTAGVIPTITLYELDGGTVQDLAERLGLIYETKATEADADSESDFDVGDPIFHFTKILEQ